MDFNARLEDESLWIDYPEITLSLDTFLQELDILFSTEPFTVMGKRSFGLSLEHMLWSTSFNADYMKSKISEQIKDACSTGHDFNWQIEIQLYKGTSRDIGVITIHIKNNDNAIVAAPTFVFK